jgi:hypothetical protein
MANDFQAELKSFNERLNKLNQSLEAMRKFGVNEELLICFLCQKLKIPRKKAEQILNSVEEFYNLLLKERIVKDMQRDKKI